MPKHRRSRTGFRLVYCYRTDNYKAFFKAHASAKPPVAFLRGGGIEGPRRPELGLVPTCQISLKSKKLFVDGRTHVRTYVPVNGRILRPTLLGRLRRVDLKTE